MCEFSHSGLPNSPAAIIASHISGIDSTIGVHGTGFFVRSGANVYFVTARHCLGVNRDAAIEKVNELLIPYKIKNGKVLNKDLLNFPAISFGFSQNDPDSFVDSGDLDIAILSIDSSETKIYKHLLSRAFKLPPTGDWLTRSIPRLRSADDKAHADIFRVIGYPLHGTATEIRYDRNLIVTQGVVLEGRVVGNGPYPHTKSLRISPDNQVINDANGLSGRSPC